MIFTVWIKMFANDDFRSNTFSKPVSGNIVTHLGFINIFYENRLITIKLKKKVSDISKLKNVVFSM